MAGSRIRYDAERARIARLVRRSEEGWLFYPGRGAALSITASEAKRIEDFLVRRLDRFRAAGERMPRRILIVGIAAGGWLMTVTALAPAYGGLALTLLMPALFAYTLWEGTHDARFRLERRRWLRAEAARIGQRLPVSADVAAHHRRYNLFQLIGYALTLGGVARLLWLVFETGDLLAVVDLPGWALVAGGALFAKLAAKVDDTHRRKRWLGMAGGG